MLHVRRAGRTTMQLQSGPFLGLLDALLARKVETVLGALLQGGQWEWGTGVGWRLLVIKARMGAECMVKSGGWGCYCG